MLFCTLTDIIPYICKKKKQLHKYLCMHACQSSKKSDCKYWFSVTNSNLQVTAGKDYIIEQRKGWLNESMFETKSCFFIDICLLCAIKSISHIIEIQFDSETILTIFI